MANILVIFGSSHSQGNCRQAVDLVLTDQDHTLVDLLTKDISYFDYKHANQEDDFIPIAEQMVQADIIIFATPIYWYAMSAMLKTFFDRLTDLVTIRKDLGKQLAGKQCYVIACGHEEKMPSFFEKPFACTCDYLNMEYKASFYYCTNSSAIDPEQRAQDALSFGKQIGMGA